MTFTPPGPVPVELLADGRIRTLAPFTWTGTHRDAIHVPAGTISDGATRPWSTAAVVDEWGPATRAFLVHDVLCEMLRRWHAHAAALHADGEAPPEPPPFTAIDTDAVLRLALIELGAHPVLARVYWAGVRWGAGFSPWRRAAWWRTLPALAAWSPLVAVLVGPAVAGALLSRGLLVLAEAAAWPFTRRAPRTRTPRRARLQLPEAAPVLAGPADRVAETLAVLADLQAAHDVRNCLCPHGNEAAAGGDCQHPTCPRGPEWSSWIDHAPWPALGSDDTPGGTL